MVFAARKQWLPSSFLSHHSPISPHTMLVIHSSAALTREKTLAPILAPVSSLKSRASAREEYQFASSSRQQAKVVAEYDLPEMKPKLVMPICTDEPSGKI